MKLILKCIYCFLTVIQCNYGWQFVLVGPVSVLSFLVPRQMFVNI